MGASFELRNVRVASPCTERWDEMSGDERVRHCAKCRLNVYDFSQLSVKEIEALVVKTEGRLCGRIHRRKDGTMLTRDCPVGLARVRRRFIAGLATTAALAASAAGALFAFGVRDERPIDEDGIGSICLEGRGFWPGVKTRAVAMEDSARELPVVGAVIEWIDPAPPPTSVMGGLIISTPPGGRSGKLEDVLGPSNDPT